MFFERVPTFYILYITIYILISYNDYKERYTPHFLTVTTVTVTTVTVTHRPVYLCNKSYIREVFWQREIIHVAGKEAAC